LKLWQNYYFETRIKDTTGGQTSQPSLPKDCLSPYHPDFVGTDKAIRADKALLSQYRWMVEEFRVSLFAQELKTPYPVSSKQLNTLWDELRTSL
jgi:hypothetical protein